MFERFADDARRVVVLAQEEARLLNHNYIGTEHILLGLVHEGEGVAARALQSLGISLESVRSRVEEIIGLGPAAPSGHIPFTPRAKKVLELSLREALQLGHNSIGTEHILLGLIREGEGVAAQVLVKLGADLLVVREKVIEILAGGVEMPAAERAFGTRLEARAVGMLGRTTSSQKCALCGRDLWEVDRYVQGEPASVCTECVTTAHRAIEQADGSPRVVVLPPRVFGPDPLDPTAPDAIARTFQIVFAEGATREQQAEVMEDGHELVGYLEEAGRRNAVSKTTVRVDRLRFSGPDEADVQFTVTIGLDEAGPRFPFQGRVIRRGDRWLVSRDTMAAVLARGGVQVPPRRPPG